MLKYRPRILSVRDTSRAHSSLGGFGVSGLSRVWRAITKYPPKVEVYLTPLDDRDKELTFFFQSKNPR